MALVAAVIFAASRFEAAVLVVHGDGVRYGHGQDEDGEDVEESHGGKGVVVWKIPREADRYRYREEDVGERSGL